MIVPSNRQKRLPGIKQVLRRKQYAGLTQGGSSRRWSGAKPGAKDGEKKG